MTARKARRTSSIGAVGSTPSVVAASSGVTRSAWHAWCPSAHAAVASRRGMPGAVGSRPGQAEEGGVRNRAEGVDHARRIVGAAQLAGGVHRQLGHADVDGARCRGGRR